MDVLWSPHANSLLEDIVLGIAEALSVEDGLRWENKLKQASQSIGEFPSIGNLETNVESQILEFAYRLNFKPVEKIAHSLLASRVGLASSSSRTSPSMAKYPITPQYRFKLSVKL